METDLGKRVLQAKDSKNKLEELLNDYIPFIKKQISGYEQKGIEYNDLLSLAMLTFTIAIKTYDESKGNFLSYASICIRNRLIDELRKEVKYKKRLVSIGTSEEVSNQIEIQTSILEYNKEKEKELLREEIKSFSQELLEYHIAMMELASICPKQKRARLQCIKLAKEVVKSEEMRHYFMQYHRIQQKELSIKFGISVKTIEKHRKYIVAVVILLLGKYPAMQTFLPTFEEVK